MDIKLLKCCSDELCSFLLITFLLQDASNNNAPPKEEQEVAHTSPDEETQGAQDRKEKNQAHDMQPQSKEQVQQEVTMNEEEMQLSQVPATDLEQDQEVSVHQGQPEI